MALTTEQIDELYPEHTKMQDVAPLSQAIGDFIMDGGYVIGNYEDGNFVPIAEPVQNILAKYFDIDLDKIEAEKRDMLRRLQG